PQPGGIEAVPLRQRRLLPASHRRELYRPPGEPFASAAAAGRRSAQAGPPLTFSSAAAVAARSTGSPPSGPRRNASTRVFVVRRVSAGSRGPPGKRSRERAGPARKYVASVKAL